MKSAARERGDLSWGGSGCRGVRREHVPLVDPISMGDMGGGGVGAWRRGSRLGPWADSVRSSADAAQEDQISRFPLHTCPIF